MPFITQGKTNWKFLLIVIILAVIVGGGALWCARRPEKPYQPVQVNQSEKKTSEIISLDETWNKYTNYKLGFSINIPKFAAISEDNENNIVISNGSYYKWTLMIKAVKNDNELDKLIKERFGSACSFRY